MLKTNAVYQNTLKTWDLPCWSYLETEISNVFRLSNEEKSHLLDNPTAKLIATIPFEAGCNEPERTAIAHLCLYIAEIQGFNKYCSHSQNDDKCVFNRLSFISTFDGGDADIIEHGMNLLAYIMIEGYKASQQADIETGAYNPFNSGAWDYNQLKNELLYKINRISVPNLDNILINEPKLMWH